MSAFLKGFVHAGRGIGAAVVQGRNLKVMLVISAVAVGLGFRRGLTATEWSLVILCMGMVLGLEIMNTALEKLVDVLHPEIDPRVGLVKDLAAGAVLTAALAAGIIGVLILLR